MNWINDRAKALTQGAIRAMFDKASTMTGVISMGIGEPDMPTPKLICQAGGKALREGQTHYTPNAGTMLLRKAVSDYLAGKGMLYEPSSEIIITNGGMGALSLLFLVLLEDGDEVLIQDPLWLNYAAQIRYCGGIPVPVPTDVDHDFIMQPETLEALITAKTKALIVNSPNNPTGSVMSRADLECVAEIAQRHDLFVISDEVYSTLVYDGAVAVSIGSLPGMKERTAVINSFSKAYAMCGWRIGYLAGPAQIVDRMTKCQENFNSCANAPGQYAAAFALSHPEQAEALRAVFAQRRSLLLEGLKRIPGIRCGDPKGAFYVFPDISGFGLGSKAFCDELLERERVVCIPGSAFGKCGDGFIRIAYTCDEDSIREALLRMERFCGSLKA